MSLIRGAGVHPLPSETPAPFVVKIGGSLLRLHDFPDLLQSWLASQPNRPLLLITGGGQAADEVRRFAELWDLSGESAHWLALRSMSFQAHLLAAVLPTAKVCDRMEDCWQEWLSGRREVVLDPWRVISSSQCDLPASWDVTSDSIAAWIAKRLEVTQLILLKSVGGEHPISIQDAVARGWLDEYFPYVRAPLQIAWVNLREGCSSRLLSDDDKSA